MRRTLLNGLAAVLFMVAALGVPAAASAQVNGGVGYRVAMEPGSTLEAGFLTLTVNPGQSASGFFFMTNTSRASAQMRIYPADGLTGVTTGVVYGSAGDALAETGSWLTPSMRSALLIGESERRIDFSVRVPPGATSGDHVGSIVLEQNGKGSANVTQIVRNVVPIRIIVPGGPGPQVVVRSASINALPGTTKPAVTVAMRNTGVRMCAPVLTVDLRGPSEKGEDVSRQLDMILPGDRVPYPLPWPRDIKPGSYVARVTTSGCGATDSITVTLDAPDLTVPDPSASDGSGKGNPPNVVTDAQPGETTFKAGDATPKKSQKNTSSKLRDRGGASDDASDGASATTPAPGSSSGGSGGAGGGAAAAAASGPTWIDKAVDAVEKHAPEVLKRATIPLLLLALVGLVFFVQEAIDRKDPKLALAPLHREPHLSFDPNPLQTRRVIPSPTLLRTDP